MAQVSGSAAARQGDRWRLPLADCTIVQACFSWLLTLRLEGERTWYELQVEQPFVLISAADPVLLDPRGHSGLLAPLLALVRRSVLGAVAFDDGRLQVAVSGGHELEVPSSDEYEPWTLTGSGGLRVVSVPGHDLEVWQPRA